MKKLLPFALLALAACTPMERVNTAGTVAAAAADAAGVPPPAVYANKTVLDEKVAIAAEHMFTFAAKAATTAIRAGLIKDRARLQQINEIRIHAFQSLLGVRRAYNGGNATEYARAYREFQAIIVEFNNLF